MPRDADIDPEAKVPRPPAEPAVESPPDGALVPADALQRYLAEIRRIPLLSREEEHELAVRWHEHEDRQAAWRLVTANLRLVVMIAREYQRAFHNLLDLVQEGNVGLLEAVKNFDPYRGIRFPSYAVWWIRAYIIRYVMNNWRLVKVGTTQAQRKLFFNLAKERERLEREGFTPSPKLIAQRLDVREKEVVEMEQRLAARDVSVDAPVGEDEARRIPAPADPGHPGHRVRGLGSACRSTVVASSRAHSSAKACPTCSRSAAGTSCRSTTAASTRASASSTCATSSRRRTPPTAGRASPDSRGWRSSPRGRG